MFARLPGLARPDDPDEQLEVGCGGRTDGQVDLAVPILASARQLGDTTPSNGSTTFVASVSQSPRQYRASPNTT